MNVRYSINSMNYVCMKYGMNTLKYSVNISMDSMKCKH